jgi:nitroreductase
MSSSRSEPLQEVPLGPAGISLIDGLISTRAIRRYTGEPIPDRVLRDILFAATRAPSGSNRQPFRFLVLTDSPAAAAAKRLIADGAQRMWAAKRQRDGYARGSAARPESPKSRMARTMQQYVDAFASVPVLILPCLNRYREPEYTEGANIYPACQNLLLAARAYGYGGVLTMFHKEVEPRLRAMLAVPDGTVLSATITLGRPAGRHGPVRRRPLLELVYQDAWGEPAPWAVDPPGAAFTAAGPPRPGAGADAGPAARRAVPRDTADGG